MKRFFRITIFLLCFIFFMQINLPSLGNARAQNYEKVVFHYEDKMWEYSIEEMGYLGNGFNLELDELYKRVFRTGITKEDASKYIFKNIESIINSIEKEINVIPQNSVIDVTKGYPKITKEVIGKSVNKEKLFIDICDSILYNSALNISIETEKLFPKVTYSQNKQNTSLKSNFRTFITGSRQEGRIHNIKTALEKFNGKVISPGETISFNSVIGDTTEENGYKPAKIILYGKYVDDYGGGVCQAATTLYNASLEAGLKVKQVNPHSLKVGYIEGSFDAMVAGSLSDLVIENPYDYPVYIYAYATEYECGVKIFGKENEYTIVRRSEKVDFDAELLPQVMYKTMGFLDYYKEGKLISSYKIRSDNYYKQKIEEQKITTVD